MLWYSAIPGQNPVLSSQYLGLGFLETLTLVLPAGFTCLRILPGFQREIKPYQCSNGCAGAVRLAGVALDKVKEQQAERYLICT